MACDIRGFSLDAFAGGTFTQVTAPEGYSARVVHNSESGLEHSLTVKLTTANGRTQIEISEDGFATATDSQRCQEIHEPIGRESRSVCQATTGDSTDTSSQPVIVCAFDPGSMHSHPARIERIDAPPS